MTIGVVEINKKKIKLVCDGRITEGDMIVSESGTKMYSDGRFTFVIAGTVGNLFRLKHLLSRLTPASNVEFQLSKLQDVYTTKEGVDCILLVHPTDSKKEVTEVLHISLGEELQVIDILSTIKDGIYCIGSGANDVSIAYDCLSIHEDTGNTLERAIGIVALRNTTINSRLKSKSFRLRVK